MDATKKPVLIPPSFSTYAEKHGIFELYEDIVKKLLIHQPDDPLQAIIDMLKEPHSVPRIIILGPPGSGKKSICSIVSEKIGCNHISPSDLPTTTDEEIVVAVSQRIKSDDCIQKGWILEGLPANRAQAHGLQASGIFPDHVVLLDAADTVLIERVMGKRIDSLTGEVYHSTFHPSSRTDVTKRLRTDPNSAEPVMRKRLAHYHRNFSEVLRCYKNRNQRINADQPRDDVISQTMSYLSIKQRNNAPHTPRVILLGSPGAGKSVQAALLENKYSLINVNCEEILKQMLQSNGSAIGEQMKVYVDGGLKIPDELITNALAERLGSLDALKKGWVLHGFPNTRNQVDALNDLGYEANRIIVLDIPSESAVERLSLRAVDFDSGERYHVLYNPPPNDEIKAKLKTHPDDEEPQVLQRYANYQSSIDDMLEFYSSCLHVNGDQDLQTVFEIIETAIVTPLPQKLERI